MVSESDGKPNVISQSFKKVPANVANDKYFINVCSAGLFTNASQKADINLKNTIGKLSYFVTAIDQFFKFRPFDVRIETKSETFNEKINLFEEIFDKQQEQELEDEGLEI